MRPLVEGQTANSLENLFKMQRGVLKSLASDPMLHRLDPGSDFSQLELRYKELKGDVGGFYIISPNGIVTHRYPHFDRRGKDFSNKPGISKVLKTKKSAVSEIFVSTSGKECIALLEPVYTGV